MTNIIIIKQSGWNECNEMNKIQNTGRKIIGSILASEIVTKFTLKYPNATKMVSARIIIKRFAALPLTFLVNLSDVFDFTNDVINSRIETG